MKQIECSVEDIHSCVLDMLKYVDKICKENDIKWYLSGGSAIGALRHEGFIPWDDDADIMMPRKDYIRFLKVMKKQKSKYKVGSLYSEKKWTFSFARVWDSETKVEYDNLNEAETGMFLDVYPMDGLPKSMLWTKIYYMRVKVCYVCLNAAIRKRFKPEEKYINIKKIMGVIMRKIGPERICRHIDNMAKKRSFETSEYVGCSVLCHYMEKERFRKKDFIEQRYVKFEDTTLPVPNGCEEYLKALYGDYMKIPDNIESEHHMRVYKLQK